MNASKDRNIKEIRLDASSNPTSAIEPAAIYFSAIVFTSRCTSKFSRLKGVAFQSTNQTKLKNREQD
jgi:hypothetical protein